MTFHHHNILVRSNESSLIEKLKEEFHFFQEEKISDAGTVIDLFVKSPPELPQMVAVKILEHVTIYQNDESQYLDYSGKALTIRNLREKNITIFSEDIPRLYELSFLCIHSILGQKLDQSGFCRLHAMAVSINKNNAVVMLPSRGGKSTILKELILNHEVKIISDDMPLCDLRGRIHPFPTKIALDKIPESGPLAKLNWNEFNRYNYPPKWTLSLSQIKEKICDNSENNINFLIQGCRISNGKSYLLEVSKWKMIKPMMEHMIIGFGLPQILEMFLSFKVTDLFKLPYHGLIRSICAFNLVRKSRCYYFYLGPDKSYNARLILDLLYEHQI